MASNNLFCLTDFLGAFPGGGIYKINATAPSTSVMGLGSGSWSLVGRRAPRLMAPVGQYTGWWCYLHGAAGAYPEIGISLHLMLVLVLFVPMVNKCMFGPWNGVNVSAVLDLCNCTYFCMEYYCDMTLFYLWRAL